MYFVGINVRWCSTSLIEWNELNKVSVSENIIYNNTWSTVSSVVREYRIDIDREESKESVNYDQILLCTTLSIGKLLKKIE